ncbi:hypothetical protein [Bradyrhizobium sp. 930_D9_N1_4]|uniref:hypothetical protein n=1 Tax=Bradyrhizobium sp. 930_D9_N1_4 TaxID=3240374 RepID=UPI003F8B42A6
MSHILSQIASVVAGVALLTTGFVVFPRNTTKSLTVSVSLAVLAVVLITALRNYGS